MRQVGSHVLTFLFGPAITAQWNRSDEGVCLQVLKKKMYFNLFLNWTDLQSKDLFIFKSKVQVYLFYSCFPDQVMLKYLQILRKAKYLMLPDTIFIPL